MTRRALAPRAGTTGPGRPSVRPRYRPPPVPSCATGGPPRVKSLSSCLRRFRWAYGCNCRNKSHIPRRHGGRHRRGLQGGLPGGELADDPQAEHATDEVVEVEPGQLVLMGQPEPGREREAAPDDDAERRDEPVLRHEVAHDVALARADRAARADLPGSRVHVERRESE